MERLRFGLLAVTIVPGVVLAVASGDGARSVGVYACVNLPYTVHLFRRALREGQAPRAGLAVVLALAAILYPLGMVLLWRPGS